MGKVTATGFDSVSAVIRSSSNNRYYFASIDLLFNSLRMILDEYTEHNQTYKAVSIEVLTEVHSLGSGWATRVRPELQQIISARVRRVLPFPLVPPTAGLTAEWVTPPRRDAPGERQREL